MPDEEVEVEETVEEPEEEVTEPGLSPSVEEEEELLPSTVHPSAPAGFTEADVDPAKGEFFIGMWGELANYGCPFCYFSTIEGSGAVELHIFSRIDSGDIKHRDYAPVE